MKKKQKYFNLETFDYTPYARELTEEEMYLVNGGRVVKGSARETEVVPSRSSSSSESGSSSGTPATSNSSRAPAATQTTTGSSQTYSSSQQSNTESQTSSTPTCTAAQMAAAKGAAANAYFAEQDKKREENNKQNNNSGSSSSSSSSSSALSHQEQYEMAQKDSDEHYGKNSSDIDSNDDSLTYFYDPHNESRIYCEIEGENALDDISGLHKLEDMLSDSNLGLWATVRNRTTGIITNYYSSQEVSEAILRAESVYAHEISNPPNSGGKWIARTVSENFVEEIYFKEDIENNYQAKKEYGYSAYVLEDGDTLHGYTFYNNNGDPFIKDSNGNKVTGSSPIQGLDYDIFPGSATKTGVDPDTLYKNLFYTCYTGPNNPKTYSYYNDDEDEFVLPYYDYKPRQISDNSSKSHDITYEEKGASGVKGALFNLDVVDADLQLVSDNADSLKDNPSFIDKGRSVLTMMGFGIIGGYKTTINNINESFNTIKYYGVKCINNLYENINEIVYDASNGIF